MPQLPKLDRGTAKMCGIAGALSFPSTRSAEQLRAIGQAMGSSLAHRGPDDAGVWVDPEPGLVLAHQRLSIIDLSREGHQPMQSADGRFQLVYNGEVYNYPELRGVLESEGKNVPWYVGYGSPCRSHRPLGIDQHVAPLERHVRFRVVESAPAAIDLGPRSIGDQTTLLWPCRGTRGSSPRS